MEGDFKLFRIYSLNTHNDISMQGKFIAQILLDYIASRLEKIRSKEKIITQIPPKFIHGA